MPRIGLLLPDAAGQTAEVAASSNLKHQRWLKHNVFIRPFHVYGRSSMKDNFNFNNFNSIRINGVLTFSYLLRIAASHNSTEPRHIFLNAKE